MPDTPRRLHLDFDPARDGFAFVNRFSWTDDDFASLTAALRPLTALALGTAGGLGGRIVDGRRGAFLGAGGGVALALGGLADGLVRSIARRWSSFGLCGGMALAAIERWPQRGSVPTAALQEAPLRALLRRRQEATLRASLADFARYWALVRFVPGAAPHAPLADALRQQLDRVEASLAAGRPALLGLVGDAPDPFALHQVVAFGIERRGPLDATLEVYDPNAPGRTRHITAAPAPTPGRTVLSTDLSTGPRPGGRMHISTRPGHLSHVFVIDAEA